MGMIGRWIDERCRREPEVMRQVLARPFSPLNYFILDVAGRTCGCLVGTYGLIRGDAWTADHKSHCGPPQGRWYHHPWRETRRVGFRVAQLGHLKGNRKAARKRTDEVIVRLLKQRIQTALILSTLEQGPAPEQPAEQSDLKGTGPTETPQHYQEMATRNFYPSL